MMKYSPLKKGLAMLSSPLHRRLSWASPIPLGKKSKSFCPVPLPAPPMSSLLMARLTNKKGPWRRSIPSHWLHLRYSTAIYLRLPSCSSYSSHSHSRVDSVSIFLPCKQRVSQHMPSHDKSVGCGTI